MADHPNVIAVRKAWQALVDGDPMPLYELTAPDAVLHMCPGQNWLSGSLASRSRDNFEVREAREGTSDISFSYRLAVRRSDIDAERFKAVDLPDRPQRPSIDEVRRETEAHLRRAQDARRRWKEDE